MKMRLKQYIFLVVLLLVPASFAAAAEAPVMEALKPFLGVPYRDDGAQNDQGQWATWQQPDLIHKTPGFNCSGFLTAAARALTGTNHQLGHASRDRLGDSGPESPLGADWDFGLDLILNLSDDYPRQVIPAPPVGYDLTPLVKNESGVASGWGVDMHSQDFTDMLAGLTGGRVYFFAISRPDGRFKSGLAYYHVGLIVKDEAAGALWLYHSTPKAGTHRINLADPARLSLFLKNFPPAKKRGGQRRMFLVEVLL